MATLIRTSAAIGVRYGVLCSASLREWKCIIRGFPADARRSRKCIKGSREGPAEGWVGESGAGQQMGDAYQWNHISWHWS